MIISYKDIIGHDPFTSSFEVEIEKICDEAITAKDTVFIVEKDGRYIAVSSPPMGTWHLFDAFRDKLYRANGRLRNLNPVEYGNVFGAVVAKGDIVSVGEQVFRIDKSKANIFLSRNVDKGISDKTDEINHLLCHGFRSLQKEKKDIEYRLKDYKGIHIDKVCSDAIDAAKALGKTPDKMNFLGFAGSKMLFEIPRCFFTTVTASKEASYRMLLSIPGFYVSLDVKDFFFDKKINISTSPNTKFGKEIKHPHYNNDDDRWCYGDFEGIFQHCVMEKDLTNLVLSIADYYHSYNPIDSYYDVEWTSDVYDNENSFMSYPLQMMDSDQVGILKKNLGSIEIPKWVPNTYGLSSFLDVQITKDKADSSCLPEQSWIEDVRILDEKGKPMKRKNKPKDETKETLEKLNVSYSHLENFSPTPDFISERMDP